MTIQVPPPVGSSGQFIDSLVITSSTNRQIVLIGDSVSSGAFAPVTSSAGALVNVSSGTFTLSNTVLSLSSGTVTVSNPTTAVTVTNPSTVFSLSSTPTFVSASSGLVQISNPTTAVTISNTSFTVNLSTVFSLSSAPLVVVASSGGTIPVSLSTVFSLSSTPLVQTASSSLVGLTSAPVVQTASSGVVQVLQSTGTAGGVTSTFIIVTTITNVKNTAGRLMGYNVYTSVDITGGSVLVFYNLTTSVVTLGTSQTMVVPIPGLNSTGAVATVNPSNPVWFGPNGLGFGTAISVAAAATATAGAVISTATPVYLTAFYV